MREEHNPLERFKEYLLSNIQVGKEVKKVEVWKEILTPFTTTLALFLLTFFYFKIINNKVVFGTSIILSLFAYYILCWKNDIKSFKEVKIIRILLLLVLSAIVSIPIFYGEKYVFYNLHKGMLNYFPAFELCNLLAFLLVIPIIEELVYRWAGGKIIEKSESKLLSFIIISVLYALATPYMYMWLPRFFMGIGLLLIKRESKNIFVCIVANALLTGGLLYIMSKEYFVDNSKVIDRVIEKRIEKARKGSSFKEGEIDVRMYTYIGEEVISTLDRVIYKDGLIFMKKDKFVKLLEKHSNVIVKKLSEDRYYFDLGSRKVEVDFNKMVSTIETNDFSKNLDINYEKVKFEESENILSSYNEIKKKLEGRREYKLTYKDDNYFILNDLIPALSYEFLGKEFIEKEYIITDFKYENMGVKELRGLNEFSYFKLKEILEMMEGFSKVQEGISFKLEENKNKFQDYFLARLAGYVKEIDRGYFKIVEKREYFKSDKYTENYFEIRDGYKKNYIKFDNFDFNQTKEIYDYFMSVDKNKDLIIDIKNLKKGNDFNMYYLLSVLIDKDLKILYKVGGERVEVKLGDMSELSYQGKITVLTSERTYGLGSIFASIVKDNKIGEIVGLNTSGGTYLEEVKILPNGIIISTLVDIEYMNEEYKSVDKGVEVDVYIE